MYLCIGMIKLALIASYSEFSKYARVIANLSGVEWVGCYIDGGLPEGMDPGRLPVAYYRSADMLLEKSSAVIIACGKENRFEHSSHALRRSCAVWSVFPIGNTLDESRKLISLAHEARVCNQVGYIYRYHSLLEASRCFLQDVRLIRTDIRYKDDGEYDFPEKLEEILFPHLDRMFSLMASPVKKVRCHWLPFPQNGEGVVVIEFDSGQFAQFWIERSLDSSSRMHLLGTDFSVDLDFSRYEIRVFNRKDSCMIEPDSILGGSWVETGSGPLQTDIKEFVSRIECKSQAKVSFAESLTLQEIICKIKKTIQRYG